MSKTIKLPISIFAILLILALSLLGIFNNTDRNTDYLDKHSTSIYSEEADQSFVSSVIDHSNINSGIKVFRIEPHKSSQINYISFVVLNYSEEYIVFSDQGFDYSIYWYDDNVKTWKEILLSQFPDRTPKLLPPQLEEFNYDIQNSWTILENDIENLPYKHIRLYVSGIGQVSNTVYGSYIDININP